jgi:hypothetical protein
MAQQDQSHVYRRWSRFERFMCRQQVVMRDHASGADMSVVHIFILPRLLPASHRKISVARMRIFTL